MPVILTGEEALAWIDPAIDDAKKLTDLLRPFAADKMVSYAVDPLVGNVKNNRPECVKAI